jgi:hypothetical protein
MTWSYFLNIPCFLIACFFDKLASTPYLEGTHKF